MAAFMGDDTDDDFQFLLYYYVYPAQTETKSTIAFHEELLSQLGITGRVRVAETGLNCILSGRRTALGKYVEGLASHLRESLPNFPEGRIDSIIDLKFEGPREDIPAASQVFTDLQVRQTATVVACAPTPQTDQPARIHKLSPEEWQIFIEDSSTICIDTRNSYESAVGYFPGYAPNIRKFTDLTPELLSSLGDISGKRIAMYCTGGVRCDMAKDMVAAWASTAGSQDVALLDGGICRYLEKYADNPKECKFKGRNFVFDPRRTSPLANGVVGTCVQCNTPYDDYDAGSTYYLGNETRCCKCRSLVLLCPSCRLTHRGFHDQVDCRTQIFCGKVSCIANARAWKNV